MWAHMPDQTRDNAFALLTTLEGYDGNLQAANADFVARVGDDFAFAMAANLKAALSAQVSTPIDAAAMRASGITKLISTILREIEQGQDNATALAEILVARHSVPDDVPALDVQVAPDPEPVEAKEPPAPAPEPEPAPVPPHVDEEVRAIVKADQPADVAPDVQAVAPNVQAAIDDLAEDFGGKAERPKAPPKRNIKDDSIFPMFELEPESAEQPAVATPAPVEPAKALSEGTIMVCNDMIAHLAAVGKPKDSAERDSREMYDESLEALNWIDEALADVANDDAPRMSRLQHMTEEATDLIQLLRMEDTDSSAMDAITVLLQMKRTVHATLAA